MGGEEMRMKNAAGRAIYINAVEKRGKVVFVVKAIGDNRIMSRDKKPMQSRTFAQEHQAWAWVERNGYKAD